MADAWCTHACITRRCSMMLGLVEVNIYKCLSHFKKDKFDKMMHEDFCQRLAWAFFTLGRDPFLDDDIDLSETSHRVVPRRGGKDNNHPRLLGAGSCVSGIIVFYRADGAHIRHFQYIHVCGYCGGKDLIHYCETFKLNRHGMIHNKYFPRSKKECTDRHKQGDQISQGVKSHRRKQR